MKMAMNSSDAPRTDSTRTQQTVDQISETNKHANELSFSENFTSNGCSSTQSNVGCTISNFIYGSADTCLKYKQSFRRVLTAPGRHQIYMLVVLMAFLLQVGNCGLIDFDMPEIVEHGSCPKPNILDVDLEKFGGFWYQVEEVPNQYVFAKKCIRTKYLFNGTSLLVTAEGLDDYEEYVDTEAVLSKVISPHPSQTPYLKLTARNVPPVPYYILESNYTSYACVYSCLQVMDLKVQVYSILSRAHTPAPESLSICKNIFQNMSLSLVKLKPVKQGEGCWYNEKGPSDDEERPPLSEAHEEQPTRFGSHAHGSQPRMTSLEETHDFQMVAESENILHSVMEEMNDEEMARDIKPIQRHKQIHVGDDTIVNLNITKVPSSSSSSSSSSSGKKKGRKENATIDERNSQRKERGDRKHFAHQSEDKVETTNEESQVKFRCDRSGSSEQSHMMYSKTNAIIVFMTVLYVTVRS